MATLSNTGVFRNHSKKLLLLSLSCFVPVFHSDTIILELLLSCRI